MHSFLRNLIVVAVVFVCGISGAANFYIDQSSGNDVNDGLSPANPWKTLAKAGTRIYGPGDSLLLKRGETWQEPLRLQGRGESGRYFVLASYGSGGRPAVTRGDTLSTDTSKCATLYNASFCRVEGILFALARNGIIVHQDSADGDSVSIVNCRFEHIWGAYNPFGNYPGLSQWPYAINFEGAKTRNAFVEACSSFDAGGLTGELSVTNFQIKNCRADHNGIYGFVISGPDTGTMENCVAYHCGDRSMPWGSTAIMLGWLNNFTIRDCRFEYQQRQGNEPDGCGMDFEVYCRNVRVTNCQFNYNAGIGVMFFHNPLAGSLMHSGCIIDSCLFNGDLLNPPWAIGGEIYFNGDGNEGGAIIHNTFNLRPGVGTTTGSGRCNFSDNNTNPELGVSRPEMMTLTPSSTAALTYDSVRFHIQVYDQYFKPINAAMIWTVTGGGTIDNSGLFISSGEKGSFIVRATVKDYPLIFAEAGLLIRQGGITGYIGYWPLNEYSGAVARDSFETGHGIPLAGNPVWTTGWSGNALSFDGADDNGAVVDSVFSSTVGSFSIACWVKPGAARELTPEANAGASGVSGQRYALMPHRGTGTSAGAGLSVGTNGVSVFEHSDAYLPSLLVYDTTLRDWTHIALVYTNNRPKLYLNGILVRTGLQSGRPVHPSIWLGGSSYGWYQGLIDEVYVYPFSLTGTQVAQVMAGNLQSPGEHRMAPAVQTMLNVSPNPFIQRVNVSVTGCRNTADLKIYDINGKVVADLSSPLNSGSYGARLRQVVWNAAGHASGVYLVVLKSGKTELKQKVLLVR